jgi:hypothetical protein
MDANDPTPPNLAIALLKALFGVIFCATVVGSSTIGALWAVLRLMNFEHCGDNGLPLVCAFSAAIAAAGISVFVVRRILKAMAF